MDGRVMSRNAREQMDSNCYSSFAATCSLRKPFGLLGRKIGARPLSSALFCLLLAAPGLVGLFLMRAPTFELDEGFVAANASSKREIAAQMQFFGAKGGDGDPWYLALFAIAKRGVGGRGPPTGGMLAAELYDEFFAFHERVTHMELLDDDGARFRYADLCQPLCDINDPLIKLMENSWLADLDYPVSRVQLFDIDVNIGKHVFNRTRNANGRLVGADVLAFYFTAFTDDDARRRKLEVFERAVGRLVAQHNSRPETRVELIAHGSSAVSDEISRGTTEAMLLTVVGYALSAALFLGFFHCQHASAAAAAAERRAFWRVTLPLVACALAIWLVSLPLGIGALELFRAHSTRLNALLFITSPSATLLFLLNTYGALQLADAFAAQMEAPRRRGGTSSSAAADALEAAFLACHGTLLRATCATLVALALGAWLVEPPNNRIFALGLAAAVLHTLAFQVFLYSAVLVWALRPPPPVVAAAIGQIQRKKGFVSITISNGKQPKCVLLNNDGVANDGSGDTTTAPPPPLIRDDHESVLANGSAARKTYVLAVAQMSSRPDVDGGEQAQTKRHLFTAAKENGDAFREKCRATSCEPADASFAHADSRRSSSTRGSSSGESGGEGDDSSSASHSPDDEASSGGAGTASSPNPVAAFSSCSCWSNIGGECSAASAKQKAAKNANAPKTARNAFGHHSKILALKTGLFRRRTQKARFGSPLVFSAALILGFAGLTWLASRGLWELRASMDYRQMLPADSPAVRGFNIMDTIWNDFLQILYIVRRPPDFEDRAQFSTFQEFVWEATSLPQANPVTRAHMSWLFDYSRSKLGRDFFADARNDGGANAVVNMSHFHAFINNFPFNAWRSGVKFDYAPADPSKAHPRIDEMLVMVAYEGTRGLSGKRRLIDACRRVAARFAQFDVVVFDTDSRTVDIIHAQWPLFKNLLTVAVFGCVCGGALLTTSVCVLATIITLIGLSAQLPPGLYLDMMSVPSIFVIALAAIHFGTLQVSVQFDGRGRRRRRCALLAEVLSGVGLKIMKGALLPWLVLSLPGLFCSVPHFALLARLQLLAAVISSLVALGLAPALLQLTQSLCACVGRWRRVLFAQKTQKKRCPCPSSFNKPVALGASMRL